MKIRLSKRIWLIVSKYDGWIGYFRDYRKERLYLFPIPWVGIRIDDKESTWAEFLREIDEWNGKTSLKDAAIWASKRMDDLEVRYSLLLNEIRHFMESSGKENTP